jgi:steroid 5-alpha reductase family enzyme
MQMSELELLLYGQIAASGAMTLAWLWAKRIGNISYVDAFWAYGVGIMSLAYLLEHQPLTFRNKVMIGLLTLWSLRLGTYLLKRCLGGKEDSRYQFYRDKWGQKADSLFFWFYQKQAFWVVLFASPLLIVRTNQSPWGTLDFVGITIWGISMIGVCLADWQLARHKASPDRKPGDICKNGLWRYSRHPNYFFEWTGWISYLYFGWSAPLGPWLGLIPIILLAFLLKFTGIPHVEARKLENANEEYEEYRRSTNSFFPWFPQKKKRTKQ